MSKQSEMQTLSLQDVIKDIEHGNCYGPAAMLEAADLIKCYFGRPAHEVKLNDIREVGGHFVLYLSFLRVPLAEVDTMVETANRVAAKLHVMQRQENMEHSRKTPLIFK